jgi:hypothetical protein
MLFCQMPPPKLDRRESVPPRRLLEPVIVRRSKFKGQVCHEQSTHSSGICFRRRPESPHKQRPLVQRNRVLLVRIKIFAMISSDHDTGPYVSAVGTVIFWLVVFWTPGLVFAGYLLLPRRPNAD